MICQRKNILYEMTWLKYLISNYMDNEALELLYQEEERYINTMKLLGEFSKKFINIQSEKHYMTEEETLDLYTSSIKLKENQSIYNPDTFFNIYFYRDFEITNMNIYFQRKEFIQKIMDFYYLVIYTVLNREEEEEFDANNPSVVIATCEI